MKTETLDSLKTRRSIRSYKPEQITQEEMDIVLEAGMFAATGMGKQSPKMVAVRDKEMVSKLSMLVAQAKGTESDPFYGAPAAIIVFADRNIKTYLYDGSLVMGNLMLAAYAAGLGSCWIHDAKEAFDSMEGVALMKKWGIPDNFEGIATCILGYPACEHPVPKERKTEYVVKL